MDKDVMKAIADHGNARAEQISLALLDGYETVDGMVTGLAAALYCAAGSFATEADLWTNSKRKGWQSTATELRKVARHLSTLGGEVLKVTTVKRVPIELSHATNGQLVYRPDDEELTREETSLLPIDGVFPDTGITQTEVPHDATLAYLRGDIDTLPVAGLEPAVAPSDASPDIHEEARAMMQTFPMNLPDDVNPFTDPKPPAWGGAGSGAGRYIPSGGRAFSFAELLSPPNPANVPDHWSWSQLQTSEGCGLQYRLSRVEFLPQVPQWSNIGGDAFHKASETVDRNMQAGIWQGNPTPERVAAIWERCFADAIAAVASTSPVPIGKWRMAAGGKENQDWWRVEGERMLRTFVEQRAKLAASANPRKLALLPHAHPEVGAGRSVAVEWPFTITVDGPLGPLTFTNIIDRVWECADGTLLIEDLKSGSRMPKDTGQLGAYAWGVALSGGAGNIAVVDGMLTDGVRVELGGMRKRIMGAFYDARKGIWTPAVDLLAAHPWEEFVYRLHSAEAKRRAGLYTPHVTDLCVACPVQYACPMRNRSTGGTP